MSLENQFAGTEAGKIKSAERSFWDSVFGRRDPEPTYAPTSPGDPMQNEVDKIEIALNKAKNRVESAREQLRPRRLALSSGVSAKTRLFIEAEIRDLTPEFEAASREVIDLSLKHRELLLAQRNAAVATNP